MKWTPTDAFTVTANYVHTNLWSLPDFGVPYNTVAGAPVTSLGVPRDTYYGFVNRDFQKVQQDFGTVDGEYKVNDFVTLEQQDQGRKIDPELYRHHPRAGHRIGSTCNSTGGNFASSESGQLDGLPQSAEPLSGHRPFWPTRPSATIKFDTGRCATRSSPAPKFRMRSRQHR